jgi:hypothetical protein
MGLFTQEIENKLEAQFSFEHSLENLNVICKAVTAWGEGVLYFVSQDPVFKHFLLCLQVNDGIAEFRSVCKTDIDIPPLRLDPDFKEMNAMEVFRRLSAGDNV